MSCKSIQSKLSAYLDGEMSGTDMLNTRAHINQCQECQLELEYLKSIQMVLRGMPAAPECSDQLPVRIIQSVGATKRTYLRLGLILAVPAVALAVAAFYPRPVVKNTVDRDLAINRQLASDQLFDAGNDSTSGASLVHYTSYESR